MKSVRNKKNKTRERMSDALFGELKESLGQALQHASGKRADLRVTVLPAPPLPMSRSEIVELRGELNCSLAQCQSQNGASVGTRYSPARRRRFKTPDHRQKEPPGFVVLTWCLTKTSRADCENAKGTKVISEDHRQA